MKGSPGGLSALIAIPDGDEPGDRVRLLYEKNAKTFKSCNFFPDLRKCLPVYLFLPVSETYLKLSG